MPVPEMEPMWKLRCFTIFITRSNLCKSISFVCNIIVKSTEVHGRVPLLLASSTRLLNNCLDNMHDKAYFSNNNIRTLASRLPRDQTLCWWKSSCYRWVAAGLSTEPRDDRTSDSTSYQAAPNSRWSKHRLKQRSNASMACCRCHSEPVRRCLSGEEGRCPKETKNSTRMSLSWNTSDTSMESPKYDCHSAAPFQQKRSRCLAVSSPLPQLGHIGDGICPMEAWDEAVEVGQLSLNWWTVCL